MYSRSITAALGTVSHRLSGSSTTTADGPAGPDSPPVCAQARPSDRSMASMAVAAPDRLPVSSPFCVAGLQEDRSTISKPARAFSPSIQSPRVCGRALAAEAGNGSSGGRNCGSVSERRGWRRLGRACSRSVPGNHGRNEAHRPGGSIHHTCPSPSGIPLREHGIGQLDGQRSRISVYPFDPGTCRRLEPRPTAPRHPSDPYHDAKNAVSTPLQHAFDMARCETSGPLPDDRLRPGSLTAKRVVWSERAAAGRISYRRSTRSCRQIEEPSIGTDRLALVLLSLGRNGFHPVGSRCRRRRAQCS